MIQGMGFMSYCIADAYFEEIEHTADIGLKSHAATLPQLFANMAFGMYCLISTARTGTPTKSKKVTVTGKSLEELLVDWLNELNYLLSVHHYIATAFSDLVITLVDDRYILKAMLQGVLLQNYKKSLKTEIKAVTYHQLSVVAYERGYSTQVIFDI
jgi:SHS2 domain-containing protein